MALKTTVYLSPHGLNDPSALEPLAERLTDRLRAEVSPEWGAVVEHPSGAVIQLRESVGADEVLLVIFAVTLDKAVDVTVDRVRDFLRERRRQGRGPRRGTAQDMDGNRLADIDPPDDNDD